MRILLIAVIVIAVNLTGQSSALETGGAGVLLGIAFFVCLAQDVIEMFRNGDE